MLLSHGHLTGELGQGHQKTQQGTIQAHLLDKSAKRWQTPARARQRPMGVPPPMSAVGPWPGLGERWHRSTGAEPSWHGGGRVERLGPVAWNTAGSGAFPSGYEGPWLGSTCCLCPVPGVLGLGTSACGRREGLGLRAQWLHHGRDAPQRGERAGGRGALPRRAVESRPEPALSVVLGHPESNQTEAILKTPFGRSWYGV